MGWRNKNFRNLTLRKFLFDLPDLFLDALGGVLAAEDGGGSQFLCPHPTRALLASLNRHAKGGEFIADEVGERPLLLLAQFAANFDH